MPGLSRRLVASPDGPAGPQVPAGTAIDLTQQEADALAGDWYRWYTCLGRLKRQSTSLGDRQSRFPREASPHCLIQSDRILPTLPQEQGAWTSFLWPSTQRRTHCRSGKARALSSRAPISGSTPSPKAAQFSSGGDKVEVAGSKTPCQHKYLCSDICPVFGIVSIIRSVHLQIVGLGPRTCVSAR
jgi:hypothetical protein